MIARRPEAGSTSDTMSSWPSNARVSKLSIAARTSPGGPIAHLPAASRLRAGLCTLCHKGCFLWDSDEIYVADSSGIPVQTLHPDLDRVDLRILDLLQDRGHLSA